MAKSTKTTSINLGQLQEEFQLSQREWQASERALARAQESRDSFRAKAQAADAALRDATRTVLG